jgi:hypothetical protein
MHDAFSPIGLMTDFWDDRIRKGTDREIPVIVINDTDREWKGSVIFRIKQQDKVVSEKSQEITVGSSGQSNCSFHTGGDLKEGSYTIEVSLEKTPYGTVKSIRDFRI